MEKTRAARGVKREEPSAFRTRKAGVREKRVPAWADDLSDVEAINCKKPGDSIGSRYDTALEAVKLVQSGLPFNAIERFHRTSGLTRQRIKQLARLSDGSLARRKQGGRLSMEESERLMRLGRVFERATALYDGDQNSARQWLETPIPALGNQRPLDLSQTEPGAREVEDLICRIEYGVVS